MRDPENIASVAELRPDYMGFIFYKRSPRYAGDMPECAINALPKEIGKVGVFVNASYDEIGRIVDKYRLDMAQLHGDESAEFCATVRKLCSVIKGIGIESAADVNQASKMYANAADYLLFDSRTPVYGGSGKKFDRSALDNYGGDIPFFLSGGIGADDFALNEITLPGFHAIDVNSRFEIAPALKNIKQLNEFFKRIKNYEPH